MEHQLNANRFDIMSHNGAYIASINGIATALEVVSELPEKRGVSVYMNQQFFMNATEFASWATRMNNLINRGTGWNGNAVA